MVSSEQLTLKSPNDAKLYRLVVLDNGLQALLVHDPEIGQQHQHIEQLAQPGAAPGRDALEGSDEDVDSLLSGDEDESGTEVGGMARAMAVDGCGRKPAGIGSRWQRQLAAAVSRAVRGSACNQPNTFSCTSFSG